MKSIDYSLLLRAREIELRIFADFCVFKSRCALADAEACIVVAIKHKLFKTCALFWHMIVVFLRR